MSQKVSKKSKCSVEQEKRILLAMSALRKGEISTIREAARTFDVSRPTLQNRLRGIPSRLEKRANCHKLTEDEEESLVNWILSMDQRGTVPRLSHIKEMADLILSKRGTLPIETVGVNWAHNFIKRRHELRTRHLRKYNHLRMKYGGPTPNRSTHSEPTPYNIEQFEQLEEQVTTLKTLLEHLTSPSPIYTVMNQFIKGCETAMDSIVNLAKEYQDLRAAYEKLLQAEATRSIEDQ